MIIDNQLASLASSLTPEQLRGPSPEDAPDRTARPTAPLEGLRPALTDDVSVTVSFVQQVLVQTAIEVIDRRLEKDGDDLTTSPVNAPPVADPTGSASPRAEKIADRVLHRIGKRLDHALKKIARLESRPREDVRHVEKRLTQVVHELSKALSVALRGTFALLRDVGVEDNKGGRLLGEIRDRLLPGVGQLATRVRD